MVQSAKFTAPYIHFVVDIIVQLIQLSMNRFLITHTLIDITHPRRRRIMRTEEVISAVEHTVTMDPNELINHRESTCTVRIC